MTQPAPIIINDIADLYRLLDQSPQWEAALRNRLLGEKLLRLPEQLAELTGYVAALQQGQDVHREQLAELVRITTENTAQLAELRRIAEEHTAQLAGHTRQLEEHTAQFVELRRIVEGHTALLEGHTRQLEEHTAQFVELRRIVEGHTALLEGHTRQLEEHTAQFVELRRIVEGHTALLEGHTRQLEEHTAQFVELRRIVEGHTALLEGHTAQFVELRRTAEIQTIRMNRMEGDMGGIKGYYAESRAERTMAVICVMLDLEEPRRLSPGDLLAISRDLGLERANRRSFVDADLVFAAQDADGVALHCAVEISWTVAQRDLDRARRNAELLGEWGGTANRALAAGQRYDEGLDWSGVEWVALEP